MLWNQRMGSWDSMMQKHICSWSLKLIFCSFEVLMSTSKLQNMKSKLQLEILFWWYALSGQSEISSWALGNKRTQPFNEVITPRNPNPIFAPKWIRWKGIPTGGCSSKTLSVYLTRTPFWETNEAILQSPPHKKSTASLHHSRSGSQPTNACLEALSVCIPYRYWTRFWRW